MMSEFKGDSLRTIFSEELLTTTWARTTLSISLWRFRLLKKERKLFQIWFPSFTKSKTKIWLASFSRLKQFIYRSWTSWNRRVKALWNNKRKNKSNSNCLSSLKSNASNKKNLNRKTYHKITLRRNQ